MAGIDYWQSYKNGDEDLPPLNRETVVCMPYSENEKRQYMPGDKVCVGEDEDAYIWECRAVSDNDWCNIHSPESDFGYLAWKLVDGVPEIEDPNLNNND